MGKCSPCGQLPPAASPPVAPGSRGFLGSGLGRQPPPLREQTSQQRSLAAQALGISQTVRQGQSPSWPPARMPASVLCAPLFTRVIIYPPLWAIAAMSPREEKQMQWKQIKQKQVF